MKLLWAPMSPFARKVMMVAHEGGTAGLIELEQTSVDMARPNDDVQPFNPLGKIPTLVLDDGTALYDSRTICEYLASRGSAQSLFPSGEGRWDALRRQALGDGMMDALILWRQERLKDPAKRTERWLSAFAIKIERALAGLELEAERLSQQPFDIGHVALGCALGYIDLRFPDLAWREGQLSLAAWHDPALAWREARPRLAAWYETFDARPSAQATRPPPPA